jgi:alpha-beta hydrolase superfamily lysophospholipase
VKRIVAGLLVLILPVAFLMRPLAPRDLESRPRPAADYAEAVQRIASLQAMDDAGIASECRTELKTHGMRAARVVVFFHGLTNCPAQFDSLGRMCFARGANVVIGRVPRHGRADRMTSDLARLEVEELRDFTDRVVDAAQGLGDSVTVCGLSVGGVMAAWACQTRSDVDRAVLIAPMLSVAAVPRPLVPAATRLAAALPNAYIWWDDSRREALPGPRHVYPRFATRAVAGTLLLGGAVLADARRRVPACRSIAVVTVGGDRAVDNEVTRSLTDRWQRHGRAVERYEFPAALHLNHDIVDPEQVGGNPRVTYPVLMERLIR